MRRPAGRPLRAGDLRTPDRRATLGEPGVKAIISDIHSNLEALQAVLADIQQPAVSEIYCLGAIVGYGPNPRECIDLVMKCRMVQSTALDFASSMKRTLYELDPGSGRTVERAIEHLEAVNQEVEGLILGWNRAGHPVDAARAA